MKKSSLKYLYLGLSITSLVAIALSVSATRPLIVKAEEIGDYGDAPRMPSMTIYGDPSREMGFCWTTTNYTDTHLQVAEKSAFEQSSGWDDQTLVKKAFYDGTIEASKIAGDGFIHKARARNLVPDTEYVYRFGDEELNNWVEMGSFKTSAATNRNFSFLHISDPQGDNALHYASYNQLLNDVDKGFAPEWIALTGDITDDSHFGKSVDLNEWEMALTDQWPIFKHYPVAAVSGNHDGALYAFDSRYNFASPSGSDTSTGSYYSFDYQGVHFTCLNSNDTSNPKDPETSGLSHTQLAWAEADLAAHQNDKFLIVMMHKGLFDSGGHSCNYDLADYDIEKMRQQLAPMFTKYGVDLVLEGHDHLYNLSYPIVADNYVGQNEYYRVDDNYNYSYRDFGEHKDVYTFSNLEGTFYFNTGTASGQKYYAPVIDGKGQIDLTNYIFNTANPNQKMFTMVDVLDNSILLRTYTCSSNETKLYRIYAIASDSEGTPVNPKSEYDTDFEIKGDYSFTYKFARYNYSANVYLKSQKLVPAESDLAGKFIGTFTSNNLKGNTICKLYRTGKVTVNSTIDAEEPVIFNTTGEWHMDDNKNLIISIKDEKDAMVNYIARISDDSDGVSPLTLILAIGVPVLVIGLLVGLFIILKKKKKT